MKIQPSGVAYRIGWINHVMDMGWRPDEIQMLSNAMQMLSQVQRYKGGVHLAEQHRDNTCDHTLESVRLASEIFADATIENADLKKAIVTMIMVHDMGEAFGEFTSLDSRVKAIRRIKIPKTTERDITDFILSWSYVYRDKPVEFHRVMDAIQQKVTHADSPEAMAAAAVHEMRNKGLPDLPEEGQKLVNKWMHYFDEVEGFSARNFSGAAAKMIEKLQSQEHFTRHCGKHGGTPFNQATSASVVATLSYSERKLGDLFVLAKTVEEKSLAKVLRERCYRNIINIIEQIPPLVQLREPEPERDPPAESPERPEYIKELLYRHRKQRTSREDPPLCTETRYRILQRYKAALSGGYVPAPGQSIIDEYLNPTPRERIRA
jgi:hypothetical protein